MSALLAFGVVSVAVAVWYGFRPAGTCLIFFFGGGIYLHYYSFVWCLDVDDGFVSSMFLTLSLMISLPDASYFVSAKPLG